MPLRQLAASTEEHLVAQTPQPLPQAAPQLPQEAHPQQLQAQRLSAAQMLAVVLTPPQTLQQPLPPAATAVATGRLRPSETFP